MAFMNDDGDDTEDYDGGNDNEFSNVSSNSLSEQLVILVLVSSGVSFQMFHQITCLNRQQISKFMYNDGNINNDDDGKDDKHLCARKVQGP